MATTRITYTDGTSETVPITMRATCKAEAHAIDMGWGANHPVTRPFRRIRGLRGPAHGRPQSARLRALAGHRGLIRPRCREGGTGRGKPYGLAAWPQDSLGRLSFLLASRFGGTPWQWRNEADELDWGTGLAELLKEAESRKE